MKAFTIIEVLVVIAIVGILSGVVLSSASHDSSSAWKPNTGNVANAQVPEPTNYAVDTANVLTPDQLVALNTKLKGIADSGKEVGVLIVPTTGGVDIAQYGIAVGEKWKVGKEGKDNGVILIVATQDHKIHIEVGSGAEADLTDSQAGDIIRDAVSPKLHAGDWNGGITAGVDAINSNLK